MRKHRAIAPLLFVSLLGLAMGDVRAEEREHSSRGTYVPQFASSKRKNRGGEQGGSSGGQSNNNGGGNNNGNNNNGNGNNNGSGGGGGGGGGGGSVSYKPREQDKIYDGAQKGADPYQKKEEEASKNFSTELAKMSSDFNKQLDKAKIPESDALLKQIANDSANVTQLSGVASDTVNSIIGDEKGLGDTTAKGYQIMAQAFANAPVPTPTPQSNAPSVGDEIASLTGGRVHGGGGSVASAMDGGAGKTSPLQQIKGPGANLGGGEHAQFGAERSAATSFNEKDIYRAPAGITGK